MKKLWKKIGLGLIFLTMASQAHALILIEPYLGYDFSLSGDSNGTDVDFSGWGYGARLGLQLSMIMVGVSYEILDLAVENGTEFDFEQKNLGIFAGWNPKGEGIRFWVTYFADSKGEVDAPGEDEGDGFALGLGWKFKPWFAANLEYRSYSYDEPPGTDLSLDSLFLTVSFPIDLL